MLNEVLSCKNTQQHQPNSNMNSSMPNENRNHYNTVVDNRSRTLTTQSPLPTHTNKAHRYEHILSSMPENNMYGRNGHSTNHMYPGWQN